MRLASDQFERMAVEQIDSLYRFARKLARDQGKAEDLVQETYVRALRARDTFDLQACGIKPWLLRIMYNLHVSRGQREAKQPAAMSDEQLQMNESPGAESLPIDPKSFDGMDERLVRAMESLPEEYSSVMLLWAVEDLAYKEIADTLGVPLGTVMSRLHRARSRLAEMLKELAQEQRIIRK